MRPRILLTILLTALFVILSGCGTTPNCPTCGTTVNGAYAIIDVSRRAGAQSHRRAGRPVQLVRHQLGRAESRRGRAGLIWTIFPTASGWLWW